MIIVDGRERSLAEIEKAIRLQDRCVDRGANDIVEADEQGLISGRAWGMFAEPSAHAENVRLASEAGCAYEQLIDQKADGRFFDPVSGYTLATVQIKHAREGKFLTSSDGGTGAGKLAYNVSDATYFQFRELRAPCRSLFVELCKFPLDDEGNLLQKTSRVDHASATVSISKRKRTAHRPEEMVELLKTMLFFVRR